VSDLKCDINTEMQLMRGKKEDSEKRKAEGCWNPEIPIVIARYMIRSCCKQYQGHRCALIIAIREIKVNEELKNYNRR
jgi:hypothetical protein